MLRRIFPIVCIVVFVVSASIAACQIAAPTANAPDAGKPADSTDGNRSPSGSPVLSPAASPVASPVPSPVAEARLRIARSESPLSAMALVAGQRQSYFANERLMLDVKSLEPEAALEALSSGEQDLAILPVSVLLTAANAADFAVVGGVINKSLDVLLVSPRVQSWSDLSGAVIATRRTDDLSAGLAVRLLDAHGVRRADVTLFGVADEDARAASVVNGTSSAALVSPPIDARMSARGLRVLGQASEIAPESQGDVIVVLRRWSTTPANSELITRFLRAHIRAQEWLKGPANLSDASTALTQSGRLSAAESRSTFETLIRVSAIPADGTVNRAGLAANVTLLRTVRAAERPLADADRLVDGSFLERARR